MYVCIFIYIYLFRDYELQFYIRLSFILSKKIFSHTKIDPRTLPQQTHIENFTKLCHISFVIVMNLPRT